MNTQKTKFVILGLLSIKPMSGYDIKKFIDTSIRHFWSESNGQIYPALTRLLQENLIILEQKQQKGKMVSNIYSITHTGLAALENWLIETTERKETHRDEELLKLFFGKDSSHNASIELLKKREERVREKLKKYHAIQKELEHLKNSPSFSYWDICLQNGIYHAEVELRWCQESIQKLLPQK
jgi:PadR family transcriptional regulator, regulatory protein AphA